MSPSGDIDARQRAQLDFSKVSVSMPGPDLQLKRWKRIEYEQLVDKGVFMPGDRIELIDGLLVVAEPQSSSHYIAIRLVERALARAFGEGWDVRTQAPIALDDTSEPEPDVAVLLGELRHYSEAHAADPVLVVEVALTRLDSDHAHKTKLHARTRRPESCVVD